MERIGTDILLQYSDLTYKVKNNGTGFQKVVYVDRMRRRYIRNEIQKLSQDGVEEQEEATVEDRKQSEDSLKIAHCHRV